MKRFQFLSQLLFAALLLITVSAKAQGSAPVITHNPSDTTVCPGALVSFSVAATTSAGDTLYYVWMFKGADSTSWDTLTAGGAFSGVTGHILQVVSNDTLNNYQFECIVYGDSASVFTPASTSSAAVFSVLPAPNAGIISGSSILCINSTEVLTESVTGGTWVTGDVHIGTINDTGLLTPVNAGNLVITYTVTQSCGHATASDTIHVVGLSSPGIISGPSGVCNTGTITLSESVPVGLWFSTDTTIAVIDGTTGVVSGRLPGNDSIGYLASDSNGCVNTAWDVIFVDTPMTVAPVIGITELCIGDFIVLTDADNHEMPSWTITNSNATINDSGKVTGIAAGLDTVLYTDSNACNSIAAPPFVITIQNSANAGVISGDSEVCVGSFITLTDPVPGGFWESGTSSIAWVDASGNVTGRSYGTTVISYVVSNACGLAVATDTVLVTVISLPITASIDSVPVGSSIYLSDGIPGGTWSLGTTDTSVSVNTVGKVTGVNAGTAIVTYNVTDACGTSEVYFTVYSGYPPHVAVIKSTMKDTVCLNGTLQLTDSVSGGTWSSNSANASVNATGIVTGLVGLVFDTVNYTVTNAFGTTTKSVTLYVNEIPRDSIEMDSVVSVGTTYDLASGSIGGGKKNYGTWFVAQDTNSVVYMLSDGGVYNQFVVINIGSFTLGYIGTNSCGSDTCYETFTTPGYNAVKNVTANDNNVIVYPNPNNGSFVFRFKSKIEQQVKVIVTNIVGEQVNEFTTPANSNYSIQLNQPEGVYFLNATTQDGQKYTAKIVVIE